MADLSVNALDLLTAAAALGGALEVASDLPATTSSAYIELRVDACPLGSATAHFLGAWYGGLGQLRDSGAALQAWLEAAAQDFIDIERQLTEAAG